MPAPSRAVQPAWRHALPTFAQHSMRTGADNAACRQTQSRAAEAAPPTQRKPASAAQRTANKGYVSDAALERWINDVSALARRAVRQVSISGKDGAECERLAAMLGASRHAINKMTPRDKSRAAASMASLLSASLSDSRPAVAQPYPEVVLEAVMHATALKMSDRVLFGKDAKLQEAVLRAVTYLHNSFLPRLQACESSQRLKLFDKHVILLAQAQQRFQVHFTPFWQRLEETADARGVEMLQWRTLQECVRYAARSDNTAFAESSLVRQMVLQAIYTLDVQDERDKQGACGDILHSLTELPAAFQAQPDAAKQRMLENAATAAEAIAPDRLPVLAHFAGRVAKACAAIDACAGSIAQLKSVLVKRARAEVPQMRNAALLITGLADVGAFDGQVSIVRRDGSSDLLASPVASVLGDRYMEISIPDILTAATAVSSPTVSAGDRDALRPALTTVLAYLADMKWHDHRNALRMLSLLDTDLVESEETAAALAAAVRRSLPQLPLAHFVTLAQLHRTEPEKAEQVARAASAGQTDRTVARHACIAKPLLNPQLRLSDRTVRGLVKGPVPGTVDVVNAALGDIGALSAPGAAATLLAATKLRIPFQEWQAQALLARMIRMEHMTGTERLTAWRAVFELQCGWSYIHRQTLPWRAWAHKEGADSGLPLILQQLLEVSPDALKQLSSQKNSASTADAIAATAYGLRIVVNLISTDAQALASVQVYDAMHAAAASNWQHMKDSDALLALKACASLERDVPRGGARAWALPLAARIERGAPRGHRRFTVSGALRGLQIAPPADLLDKMAAAALEGVTTNDGQIRTYAQTALNAAALAARDDSHTVATVLEAICGYVGRSRQSHLVIAVLQVAAIACLRGNGLKLPAQAVTIVLEAAVTMNWAEASSRPRRLVCSELCPDFSLPGHMNKLARYTLICMLCCARCVHVSNSSDVLSKAVRDQGKS